jgi:type II secretory pathway component PulC
VSGRTRAAVRLFQLAALTLLAWLSAQVTVEALATRYLQLPLRISLVVPPPDDSLPTLRADPQWVRAMTGRRPFNVEPPPKPKSKPIKPAAPQEPRQAPPKTPPPARTELKLGLVGTIVIPSNPRVRLAHVLVDGKERKLVAIGDEVAKGAVVVDVQRKLLLLREGERVTWLGLWDDQHEPKPGRTARRKVANWGQHVKRSGGRNYRIERAALRQALAAGRPTRGVGATWSGKSSGVRLTGVRSRSPLRALGLRSGDIVTKLNGRSVARGTSARSLLQKLAKTGRLNVRIKRRRRARSYRWTAR